VVPDNPQYIQVSSQLGTVRQEIAALSQSVETSQRQIADYERSLQIAPEVEREYRQILRDYELAQDRLRGLENDIGAATLARVLETEQRGLRYTLIRPPGRPSAPDSPNRLGIVLLGLVLGGGLAVGLAAFRESADPSIRNIRDLSDITEIRPLGVVPVMLNDADRRTRLVAWGTASIVFAAAASVVVSAVLSG
jgi:uncharacterized protein involved in exopolysaccharide biosynthesis